ncbi:hypothetical protein F506_03810 [Herbaspirillum hiltneri N3]|uniref:Transmembrane protein n=1 Tax=Herbaspirillum hiltneri N3 TaxID=1262470 RepID=A0ABN4HX85_9BURK|nr:DUF6622 family protein [Herbaspirillum hiltneri]AKZ61911.1 hypothetical protein F506_03810 [Herbaspirillum hiltneri N3]
MLQQIIIHTPLWVWAMLAFLVYRGWLAAADRESPLFKVALIPLLLLVLSLNGLYQQAHADARALAVAALAALVSGVLSATAAGRSGITPYPDRGTVWLRGSWMPLLMMVSVFAVKYTVGVLQAMHSQYVQGVLFTLAVSLLYGLFMGIPVGRLLRIVHLYRQASSAAVQSAA